jgi:hypothetical protein
MLQGVVFNAQLSSWLQLSSESHVLLAALLAVSAVFFLYCLALAPGDFVRLARAPVMTAATGAWG